MLNASSCEIKEHTKISFLTQRWLKFISEMKKLFSSVESGKTCGGLELTLERFSTGTV